jgi:hypothetical protein
LKLKGRRFDTIEEIQPKWQSAWHWQKRTSRKRSKNGGDCETDVYMWEGTTSRVIAADSPYGDFLMIFTAPVRNILYTPSYFTICTRTAACCSVVTAWVKRNTWPRLSLRRVRTCTPKHGDCSLVWGCTVRQFASANTIPDWNLRAR